MKTLFGLVVIAVVAGLGVAWVRQHADSVIHRVIDTGLPAKVEAHRWAPVIHGKARRSAAVEFGDGEVTTRRCHATLGTYGVHIDHGFFFQRAGAPIGHGCPGNRLRTSLSKATRVDLGSDGGTVSMTFTDAKHHTVASFRAVGD